MIWPANEHAEAVRYLFSKYVTRFAFGSLVAAAALLATGCSGPATGTPPASGVMPSAAAKADASAVSAPADHYQGPPTPCDTTLSIEDFAAVIPQASTINRYSMGASAPGNGCEVGHGTSFDAFVDIAVNKASAQTFATIASLVATRKPLAGIGEAAFDMGTQESNVPNATETNVYARQAESTCAISLIQHNGETGTRAVVAVPRDELLKRLGAICNKAFAARP